MSVIHQILFESLSYNGAPGWLSWLSLWLQLRSWSQGCWVPAPRGALCWQLRAWSLLWILSVSLSLPLPHSQSLSPSRINIKKNKTKQFLLLAAKLKPFVYTINFRSKRTTRRSWPRSNLTLFGKRADWIKKVILRKMIIIYVNTHQIYTNITSSKFDLSWNLWNHSPFTFIFLPGGKKRFKPLASSWITNCYSFSL